MRARQLVVVGLVVGSVVTSASAPPAGAAGGTCWVPPVDAPVSDPFRAPSCRWCAGNRGVEYATSAGQPVTAVASGRVSYAGAVAGVVYIVVRLPDGRRVTYGRLLERRVDVGDPVLRGQTLGSADRRFHLGLRAGDEYVDPTPLLGRLVTRPRLVPTDGSRGAPAPPPVLRCGAVNRSGGGAIVARPR